MRCWAIVAGVSLAASTRIIVDVVRAIERIDRQQCRRTERVLIAGRDVQRRQLLPLVLQRLIVRIWNLKPIASAHYVQMKRIFCGGVVVEMVKQRAIGANSMNRLKLGSIQKPARTHYVEREEVPNLRSAQPIGCLFRIGPKRTCLPENTSKRLFPQAGLRHRIHHEACLVAELRCWGASDQLHRLNRV